MNKKLIFLSIPYIIQGIWITQIYTLVDFYSQGILGLVSDGKIAAEEIPGITQKLMENPRLPQVILLVFLIINVVIGVIAYKKAQEKENGVLVQHISSSIVWLVFVIATVSVIMALNLPWYVILGKG